MNLTRFWGLIRPMLHWIVMAIIVFMFWQALPMDMLGMIIAGDVATYFEIAAAVWLVAQVTRLRWAFAYARHIVRRHVRRARVRARRVARRISSARASSADDDGRGFRPAYA
ncbi:MAG: hypothetical protein JO276_07470 [Sphingomonadaceae bacterium]|nr:hypothetical protein [Sphingomonadaceae bacterium]